MTTETTDTREKAASFVETVRDTEFLIGCVGIPLVLAATLPMILDIGHVYFTMPWVLTLLSDLVFIYDKYLA